MGTDEGDCPSPVRLLNPFDSIGIFRQHVEKAQRVLPSGVGTCQQERLGLKHPRVSSLAASVHSSRADIHKHPLHVSSVWLA
jgi:hypothetical protein